MISTATLLTCTLDTKPSVNPKHENFPVHIGIKSEICFSSLSILYSAKLLIIIYQLSHTGGTMVETSRSYSILKKILDTLRFYTFSMIKITYISRIFTIIFYY